MTVSDGAGKESQTHFTYDDHNRLTKLEGPDGTITYTYDKNGNRIASEKNSEKLDYIYDTRTAMKNQRISYVAATNQYYDQLSTNSYSRESEFLKNMGGMNYVKEQIYKEVGINHQDDAQAMEMLKEKNNVAYQFIQDLSKEKGR